MRLVVLIIIPLTVLIDIIMLNCIDCGRSFKTLRELRRHERCHVKKLYCVSCDCYFTTRALEKEHIDTVHRRSVGTQTEPQEQRPRPRHHRDHVAASRPRWRPAARQDTVPTPRPVVDSVVVNPRDPLNLMVDLEDHIDLNF